MLTRAQKTEQVGELKEKFARATSVYVADYRGLDVQSLNKLRRRIRSEGRGSYEYRVAKNTILRRAADGSKLAEIAAYFEGPTAIAISFGDPVGLAKIMTEFSKENEKLQLRGGMLEGRPVDVAAIGTLATLPSLDALRGKIIGLLQAPATQLARLLVEPGAQLARLVEARRGALESGGALQPRRFGGGGAARSERRVSGPPHEPAGRPARTTRADSGPTRKGVEDMADLNSIVDSLSSLTIMEAAELAKLLETKWGVSAAAPVAVAAGAGGAAAAGPVEEKDEFTVTLISAGDKKIQVIKEVRAVTTLGLKEAKDLVEGAPKVIKEGVNKEEAAKIKAQVEAAGGQVQIK